MSSEEQNKLIKYFDCVLPDTEIGATIVNGSLDDFTGKFEDLGDDVKNQFAEAVFECELVDRNWNVAE